MLPPVLLVALATTFFVSPAAAGTSARVPTEADVRTFIASQIHAPGSGAYSRIDIQVGSSEIPPSLGTCTDAELLVPNGSRLWGRSYVVMRCVGGATWSVSIPVFIRAWGNAWVAARNLPAGHTLMQDDLREDDIELSRERPGLPQHIDALLGKSLARSMQSGQAIQSDAVRAVPVLMAGDAVRLRVMGTGFSISASGQALGNAAEGQAVRVRTDLGRTLLGTARTGRIVDISP